MGGQFFRRSIKNLCAIIFCAFLLGIISPAPAAASGSQPIVNAVLKAAQQRAREKLGRSEKNSPSAPAPKPTPPAAPDVPAAKLPSGKAVPAIKLPTDKTAPSKQSTAPKAAGKVITVGLMRGQYSAVVSSSGDYAVTDRASGKAINKFAGGKTTTFAVKNRQLLIDGKPIAAKELLISPSDTKKNPPIRIGGTDYRGEILLALKADSITVINAVSLEDYIKGVVPSEMSPDWPSEALKAQAVAARTFALYTIDQAKHKADGYELCATTCCQVYGGATGEAAGANRAVEATSGEILVYNGKPIYSAFHADSGGQTADCREVWGANEPYLASVADPDGSPNRHWQQPFSASDIEARLKASGRDIGNLKKIHLSSFKAKKSSDRSVSGRVAKIKFEGGKKTVELTGTQARSVFGLKSAMFEVRQGSAVKGDVLAVNSGQKIVFDGYGSGHGLGLAQWGARAMAAKKNYREILAHYYTGAKFSQLY